MTITGTNSSYQYNFRKIYSSNRLASSNNNRKTMQNKDLISADAQAMQKIRKQLKEIDFNSDNVDFVKTNAQLFVETYNRLIDDANASDSESLKRLTDKFQKTTKASKEQLEELGINMGSNGKLSFDKTKFGKATIYKLKSTLGEDSEFMKSVESYAIKANRIQRTMSYPNKNKTTKIDLLL